MPQEPYWESLFDVPLTLDRLGIDARLNDVAELGCGYGTFSVPVARRISGTLTAVDMAQDMVDRTRQRAHEEGASNIRVLLHDVQEEGFGVPRASQDAVLLFNILHGENAAELMTIAAESVRSGGVVLVTHWRWDVETPRGPDPEIRPSAEAIVAMAENSAPLRWDQKHHDLPPWHFGLRFERL